MHATKAAAECQAGQWDRCSMALQQALQGDSVLDLQAGFHRDLQPMLDGIYEQGREMSAKPGDYTQKRSIWRGGSLGLHPRITMSASEDHEVSITGFVSLHPRS